MENKINQWGTVSCRPGYFNFSFVARSGGSVTNWIISETFLVDRLFCNSWVLFRVFLSLSGLLLILHFGALTIIGSQLSQTIVLGLQTLNWTFVCAYLDTCRHTYSLCIKLYETNTLFPTVRHQLTDTGVQTHPQTANSGLRNGRNLLDQLIQIQVPQQVIQQLYTTLTVGGGEGLWDQDPYYILYCAVLYYIGYMQAHGPLNCTCVQCTPMLSTGLKTEVYICWTAENFLKVLSLLSVTVPVWS